MQARRCLSLDTFLPAFAALAVALVLAGPSRFPDPLLTAARFGLIGLLSWLASLLVARGGRWSWPARVGGSALLLLATYAALGDLLPWSLPEGREAALVELDRRWLGYDWEAWWRRWSSAPLTDLLALVYVAFYAGPFLLGLALARRRDLDGVAEALDRIVLVFLLSYCGYLLVPARSPYEVLEFGAGLPTSGLASFLHRHSVELTATRHDCFPSGHVMVSCYVAWLAWRRARPVFWPLAAWAGLTLVATLYLRYHYLVDVLAGLAAAALIAPVFERLFGPFAAGAGAAPRTARRALGALSSSTRLPEPE